MPSHHNAPVNSNVRPQNYQPEHHHMTASNRVVSLVQSQLEELGVRWINTGRIGEDWKAKIFESKGQHIQFAVYNTSTVIQVLLERRIDPVPGTRLHDKTRPKSDAFNDSDSHFSRGRGVCYRADSETSFLSLISSYLKLNSRQTDVAEQPIPAKTPAQIPVAESQARALRLERLRVAPRVPKRITVQTTSFIRNQDVIEEVLFRASGFCEICWSPAPFIRSSNSEPYLEVHHTVPLAQSGEDTVDNAVAICPNCHRRAHHG